MASISKGRTKKGGYEVRWRDLSGRNRRRWTPTKESADNLRAAIILAKASGIDWKPTPEAPPPLRRIESAIKAYLAAMRRRWKPNTLRDATTTLGQFLDLVGDASIADLSRTMIESYFDDQRNKRGHSELTSVLRTRKVIAFWEWLFDHEDWSSETPRPRSIDLPEALPELVPWAPSWLEMDAVVEAARSRFYFGRLFCVLRFTGLRVGQAMRLEWRDVDMEDGLLTIRGELGKSKQERRGRVVPMSPHLVAEIATWGRREGYLIDTAFKHPAAKLNVKRVVDQGVLSDVWEKALGRAPRQPSHGFRKGLVSNLRALGADYDLVKHLVGHRRETLGDTYSDSTMLMPALRAVVGLIPAVGVQGVSRFDARKPKSAK